MAGVSLKDVAREAGVSVASVSYVLNGKENRVSEKTRVRVLEVVERLGYVPNEAARNLKKQSSGAVGIVILEKLEKERPRVYSTMLLRLQEGLQEKGYQIRIYGEKLMKNGQPEYVNAWQDGRIDAVVYVGEAAEDAGKAAALLARMGIPAVMVDCREDYDGLSNVRFDYAASVAEYGEFLFGEKKYRKAVYIGWEEEDDPALPILQAQAKSFGAALPGVRVAGRGRYEYAETDLNKETEFDKWLDLMRSCAGIAEKLTEEDLVICRSAVLAETMIPQLAKHKPGVSLGALGELGIPPSMFIGPDGIRAVHLSVMHRKKFTGIVLETVLVLLETGEVRNRLIEHGKILSV